MVLSDVAVTFLPELLALDPIWSFEIQSALQE